MTDMEHHFAVLLTASAALNVVLGVWGLRRETRCRRLRRHLRRAIRHRDTARSDAAAARRHTRQVLDTATAWAMEHTGLDQLPTTDSDGGEA